MVLLSNSFSFFSFHPWSASKVLLVLIRCNHVGKLNPLYCFPCRLWLLLEGSTHDEFWRSISSQNAPISSHYLHQPSSIHLGAYSNRASPRWHNFQLLNLGLGCRLLLVQRKMGGCIKIIGVCIYNSLFKFLVKRNICKIWHVKREKKKERGVVWTG